MNYDWMAGLALLLVTVVMTLAGKFLAFQVPALQRMRELNAEADRRKLSRKRFREAVKINNRSAAATNLVFFVAILPFFLTLESRPLWRHGIDIALVLMVYDFFYYLTHRFLFHGRALRKIHALHHQARTPTYIDALYVHPLETAIGLILFLGTIPLIAAVSGGPLHAISMAVAMLTFTQLNTINHTYVNLPDFPFKTLDRITSIHAAHRINMDCGNYATLTTIYDRIMGTWEQPVSRELP